MVFSLVPLENFPNEYMAIIGSVLFIVVVLTELRVMTKERLFSGKRSDQGSLYVVIIVGVTIPLALLYYLSTTGMGRINTIFSYVGLAIALIGFILRQVSIQTLGKYFTPVVSIQKDQHIIKVGPYKYIRHPSYTGLLLELIGCTLIVSNIIGLIIVVALFTPSIIYRIVVEESALKKTFGEKYVKYEKETKRLIPYLY